MPFNGAGVYAPPAADFPAVANTLIESAKFNDIINDIATALGTAILKDGTQTVTADIPFGNFKLTTVGAATARSGAANLGQVQDATVNWIAAGGTADAITAVYSPAVTALVDGQFACFRASAANATTTPTFAPNGLTARTIVKQGGTALVVGDIPAANAEVILRYNLANTRWEMLNPAVAVGGVLTGTLIDWPSTTIPAGYLERNGANVSRTTYAALYAVMNKTSVVTITIANPGVVTWNAHGLSNDDVVKFSTTGALPTGLVAGTTYYVRSAAANTFQVSATEGGASINTTGVQSGVQTAIHSPFGDGDGSTTFTLPDDRRYVVAGRGGSLTTTLGARLGAVGGEETHVMTTAELKDHTHTQSATTMLGNTTAPNTGGTFLGATSQGGTTGSTGSATAFNVVQKTMIVVKLIKT